MLLVIVLTEEKLNVENLTYKIDYNQTVNFKNNRFFLQKPKTIKCKWLTFDTKYLQPDIL